MKKILVFSLILLNCVSNAVAVTRGKNTTNREKDTIVTTQKSRTANQTKKTNRSATTQTRKTTSVATRTPTTNIRPKTSRNAIGQKKTVSARATTTNNSTETKTGAAYEQCKTAFFTCMDQFCQLKNDNFRRCSCSDRVFDFQDISDTYQSASEKITEFSENLNAVGLTKEQALAMKTASEGEDALTEDKSASKQLLQAIMNAINGEKTTVGGKYQELNSVSLTSDISNAFGMDDSGQIIASYNGTTLYRAVYPKCKSAVAQDCNNSSLQRAINAYLMSIEQDCNTVESALQSKQKTLKSAVKQSSASLDLARVENRKKHNSDDMATCLVNVETAIKSEEVCGENYHKCLDYGQFIDVTTGAPLSGVVDFYKLGELLTFKNTENLKDQKLSSINNNRTFVQFFENKTKKFAADALDKCTEKANTVWQQYLDRALLDIYYAQQAKVKQIQDSCIDIVASCYDKQSTAIANAMANLTGDSAILIKPASIKLTETMCSDYIDSCNNMFSGNIIQTYMAKKTSTDSDSACRAIAQQCFAKFGGTGYENLYYPQSGNFVQGYAIDWFSLYEYRFTESDEGLEYVDENKKYISPCAQELAKTDGCNDPNLIERVFGGFDKYILQNDTTTRTYYTYEQTPSTPTNLSNNRQARSNGIATEIYYQIIDSLSTQCSGLNGYFVEPQYAQQYGYKDNDFCKINSSDTSSVFFINPYGSNYRNLDYWYHFMSEEDVCPAYYGSKIDVQSWGACSCWENGGFRSQNGKTQKCMPVLPIAAYDTEETPACTNDILNKTLSTSDSYKYNAWCQQTTMSSLGQLCPRTNITTNNTNNTDNTNNTTDNIECANDDGAKIGVVAEDVPHHKANQK